jgi:hypothetical protein
MDSNGRPSFEWKYIDISSLTAVKLYPQSELATKNWRFTCIGAPVPTLTSTADFVTTVYRSGDSIATKTTT